MRLTIHDKGRQPYVITANERTWRAIYDKLSAYEDTGLEPDEIKEKVGFMSPVCVGCDGKTADGKRTEKCTYDEDFRKCLERAVHLSELAHAEEQGRLVILPCKVGDTVYVEWSGGREYSKSVVEKISIGADGQVQFLIPAYLHSHSASWYQTSDFGKTVFLSREEAENALRKGGGET